MQPALSFPEPTCLLVSTKIRSSGRINKLIPRALVSFAFKILILLFFQSQISTFLVFPVCIECLCGTHPHRLHLWTPNKPTQVCTVKPEVLKSWSLEIDYSRIPELQELRVLVLTKRQVGSGNEIVKRVDLIGRVTENSRDLGTILNIVARKRLQTGAVIL